MKVSELKHYVLLTLIVLSVYGCQGGDVATLGSLFGSVGGSSGLASGGSGVATITNPEPATMTLIGSGMMMMAFYKTRRKRK